ncbi:GGDEF domain-containing protein [Ferrimonas lipolytica]|uniref:diguanylate cyclase n=1 Tax=Ferrimonas lipolytica TaxID=2724191 RepID=A0A6H1UD24_9GAMM|nr:GGDEF domain-containing protein [Ferrimonas lipolytica]QIZ76490.1 GGDEF domain-containing protein [Ferrimonas lipolytica]
MNPLLNYSQSDNTQGADFVEHEIEQIIVTFAVIGIVAVALMGTLCAYLGNYQLVFFDLIAGTIFLLVLKFRSNYRLASTILLFNLYGLLITLIYSGGFGGTGPIWMLIAPPVTFFLSGLTLGVVNISLFLVGAIVAYFFGYVGQANQILSPELALRVLLCFILVTLLSATYEYFKHKYSSRLSQLVKYNEALANLDPLTNLSNRRFTLKRLEELFQQEKDSTASFALLLIDVDNFKSINDRFGHDVGDQVLIQLSSIFQKAVRKSDIVCRWGGEEFLIVLTDASKYSAVQLTERLHHAVNSHNFINEQQLAVTVSVGVQLVEEADASITESIKQADLHLYKAKAMGKNTSKYNFENA